MLGYDEKSLSVLMHELRSPINTLLGIVEQTKLNLDSKIEVEKSLEKIEGVASYLLSLSNNYLEISKNESAFIGSKDSWFDCKEVIDYVISVFNFQFGLKNINFKANLMNSNIILIGDSIKIKQILINILSNAYKYTPGGGIVSLDYKLNYLGKEEVEFKLIVKDNGIGMSKEFLEKIFTPYNCEKNEIKPNGTGLGLYIIKDSIQKMNGNLKIDSIRGQGTTVEVTLPLKIAKTKFDFSKNRILVIDDCKITLQILTGYLDATGAKYDIACDGEEGLIKYLNSPIDYYQVIVLDNKMSKLDGEIVAKRIRELPRIDARNVKIIGMSASAFEADVKRCINAGMNEYLLKPLTKDILLYTISKQITV